MPANERYCAQLVQCFDQFANWSYISDETKAQLVRFLATNARDDHEAHAAIQDLLGDTARASSTATNRVPTTGELKVWLEAQRPPEAPKAYAEMAGDDGVPNSGCGRCRDGWIFQTKRVISKGSSVPQEYEFAGRCKCVGGWL